MNYEYQDSKAIGQAAKAADFRGGFHLQWNAGYFVTAFGGYTFRSNPVPSSAALSAKAGHAGSKWYWDLWLDVQRAAGGSDYLDGTLPQFNTLGVSFVKLGGTVYKPIGEKWGLYTGLVRTVSGYNRNVGLTNGFSLGAVFKL